MAMFKTEESGLTLVELLIATLIGTLTFLILFYTSSAIQDNIRVSSGILGITETGRIAVSRICNDIREAKTVRSSYSSYSSGNTILILEIPVVNDLGTITGYDVVIYTLENTEDPAKFKLCHIVYAAAGSTRTTTSEIIAEDIKNLLFSSKGTALSSVTDKNTIAVLTVKIATAKNIMGLERLNEVTTSASLRNKRTGL